MADVNANIRTAQPGAPPPETHKKTKKSVFECYVAIFVSEYFSNFNRELGEGQTLEKTTNHPREKRGILQRVLVLLP